MLEEQAFRIFLQHYLPLDWIRCYGIECQLDSLLKNTDLYDQYRTRYQNGDPSIINLLDDLLFLIKLSLTYYPTAKGLAEIISDLMQIASSPFVVLYSNSRVDRSCSIQGRFFWLLMRKSDHARSQHHVKLAKLWRIAAGGTPLIEGSTVSSADIDRLKIEEKNAHYLKYYAKAKIEEAVLLSPFFELSSTKELWQEIVHKLENDEPLPFRMKSLFIYSHKIDFLGLKSHEERQLNKELVRYYQLKLESAMKESPSLLIDLLEKIISNVLKKNYTAINKLLLAVRCFENLMKEPDAILQVVRRLAGKYFHYSAETKLMQSPYFCFAQQLLAFSNVCERLLVYSNTPFQFIKVEDIGLRIKEVLDEIASVLSELLHVEENNVTLVQEKITRIKKTLNLLNENLSTVYKEDFNSMERYRGLLSNYETINQQLMNVQFSQTEKKKDLFLHADRIGILEYLSAKVSHYEQMTYTCCIGLISRCSEGIKTSLPQSPSQFDNNDIRYGRVANKFLMKYAKLWIESQKKMAEDDSILNNINVRMIFEDVIIHYDSFLSNFRSMQYKLQFLNGNLIQDGEEMIIELKIAELYESVFRFLALYPSDEKQEAKFTRFFQLYFRLMEIKQFSRNTEPWATAICSYCHFITEFLKNSNLRSDIASFTMNVECDKLAEIYVKVAQANERKDEQGELLYSKAVKALLRGKKPERDANNQESSASSSSEEDGDSEDEMIDYKPDVIVVKFFEEESQVVLSRSNVAAQFLDAAYYHERNEQRLSEIKQTAGRLLSYLLGLNSEPKLSKCLSSDFRVRLVFLFSICPLESTNGIEFASKYQQFWLQSFAFWKRTQRNQSDWREERWRHFLMDIYCATMKLILLKQVGSMEFIVEIENIIGRLESAILSSTKSPQAEYVAAVQLHDNLLSSSVMYHLTWLKLLSYIYEERLTITQRYCKNDRLRQAAHMHGIMKEYLLQAQQDYDAKMMTYLPAKLHISLIASNAMSGFITAGETDFSLKEILTEAQNYAFTTGKLINNLESMKLIQA